MEIREHRIVTVQVFVTNCTNFHERKADFVLIRVIHGKKYEGLNSYTKSLFIGPRREPQPNVCGNASLDSYDLEMKDLTYEIAR